MENQTEPPDRVAAWSDLSTLSRPDSATPARRHRKKANILWEQAQLASDGLYARYLREIETSFPSLSPAEVRVCALVKSKLPSWYIAEILGISEDTVENHRFNARRKMCPKGKSLSRQLSSS